VYWYWWAKIKPVIFGSGIGSGIEGGWMRGQGHKRVLSDEAFPIMRFKTYGSEDEDEDEVREEGRGLLNKGAEEGEGMRQRAPCGCWLNHERLDRVVEEAEGSAS
jgi:hypothetical protein